MMKKSQREKIVLFGGTILICSLLTGCAKEIDVKVSNNTGECLESTSFAWSMSEESDLKVDSHTKVDASVTESSINQTDERYIVENQEYVYSIAGDMGQLGEEGNYYSKDYPNDAYREVVAYQTYADVTHDGIDDLVQLSFYIDKSVSVQEYLKDDQKIAFIKVFRGITDGEYEEHPRFISREFGLPHAGNGTICLAYKEGLAYFLLSDIWEGQGRADYDSVVFYIDDKDGIVIREEASTYFAIYKDEHQDDWDKLAHREEAINGFKGMTESWAKDATILISFNIDMDPAEMNSIDGECKASDFYNQIWERNW